MITPLNEEEFHQHYLLWLQHGAYTTPMNEDIEREKYVLRCPHGHKLSQCRECHAPNDD